MLEHYLRTQVPIETQPSFKIKAQEAGVDYERFIDLVGMNKSDVEIASELGISPQTVANLREHFLRYGLGPIIGQDF